MQTPQFGGNSLSAALANRFVCLAAIVRGDADAPSGSEQLAITPRQTANLASRF
ncbi:hypothetical protein PAMC26577_36920 [Caballeronia sordidicola]|uniref:Uncharacterized protein n=1 Tax=Caballeronia sordidicola TaxID=196367 RepID=A0A242M7K8_CABSO|nr:hypothetical protein PAMC26577_36920 [Caballeronia sordidicola]